jgi:hypothetical protein
MMTDASGGVLRREWLLTVAVLGAAMLLSHPYTGIRHDGILYFGDALARLVPGELHDDLYFFYGSQGQFTLLPRLYADLIAAFGIGLGAIVGLLAAFALQLAATLFVVSGFARGRRRAYCALSVLLGWSIYGGLRVFSYGESFLTARSFAEPLVLIGLGALFRGRLIVALAGLLAAVSVHPLMGATGIIVAWIWLCCGNRRWLLLGAAGLVAYGLIGWWGRPPFDDVFAVYDSTWAALVHEANPQAFLRLWREGDFGVIAYACAVLWMVTRRVDNAGVSRIAWAALIGGLSCLAVSYVGVDLLGNPFVGKLQIWRTLWLTQWFAMACTPLLIFTLWSRGEAGRIAALMVMIGWMASFTIAPAIVAVFALLIDRFGHRVVLSRLTTRIVGGLVVTIGIVIAVQYWSRTVKMGMLLQQPWPAIIRQLVVMNLAIGVVAVVALALAQRHALAGSLVVIAMVAVAIVAWDQRSPWTRRMESYAVGTSIWPDLIKPAARVYWYRDLIAPWILLGHANYYTQQQGSGAVFSRGMTMELDHRRKLTAILDFQEQLCRMMNGLNEKADSCEPDADAVKTLCVDGAIDYVVLQSTLEHAAPLASYSTGVTENGYEKKFFLYRCSALNPGS